MVIEHVGIARKALAVYDRQQMYANRTAGIKSYKTFQVGVVDNVSISSEALVKQTAATATPAKARLTKSITYENPRKSARHQQSGPESPQTAFQPLIAHN